EGRVQLRLSSNGGFYCSIHSQGEGSGTPTEPHHTPSPEADTSHPTTSSIPLPSIPTALIPPVTQPETTPIRQYSRRARIAQSSALPTIADDPASPVRHVSKGEACPTESGFIADQDRATIAKSSTLPHDSTPRVTSPTVDEGSIPATQSGDDAPIKGRSINEGEAVAERISNDSEEVARVLTSIDAATVIAGGIDVPTGSGLIPTAGPPATIISTGSEVGPTASPSPIVTRRKGKEVMVESDTPKKKKLQEQIDAQSNLGWRLKDFKGMKFEEIEAKFAEVWKHVENFIPIGSKEETKKLKRKDLLKQLDREDLNPLWDLVKEYLSIRPGISDKEMELWVELKRMYEPDPEDQLQRDLHASRKELSSQKRRSIKFKGGLLGIKCTRHSHCQVKSSHWQYKFPLPVKVVATARRLEMPLLEVCTAIEEKKKKLLVKDRWQLH
nr:hypothetical protein [Tanacetum cinerariifolium]